MAHSTARSSCAKRGKPSYPLWQHATGQWAKKIRGRYYYFGTDKDAALKEYTRVREYLESGRKPPPAEGQRLTLRELANHFLTHKKHQVQTGEVSARTFQSYYEIAEVTLQLVGKDTVVESLQPNDLLGYRRKLADRFSSSTLGNHVSWLRQLLRYAFENALIDRPVRFGDFRVPRKAARRREKAAKGSRLFESANLRKVLEAAAVHMRGMILLAINGGLGNADCATLPIDAVDLESGWIDYPRPKTGVERRLPLWPETVEALREALKQRKEPVSESHRSLVFITQYRNTYYRENGKPSAEISRQFKKVLVGLDIYRPGLSFYALRHTFQTIGDETGDYLAVRRIMGHSDNSISDVYRERFPDERLVKVVEHVRQWLYGKEA